MTAGCDMVRSVKPDPALPGSDVLLSDDAHFVLSPAISAAGGTLLTARASQIRYTPGRRLIVRYAAEVEWAGGERRTETLGALVQKRALPEGLSVLEGEDGSRIGVWRYPHDPFLPGLPAAAYPDGAQAVLAHLGIATATVRVEPVVYRPGSRAVLRVTADDRVVYLKVARPGKAARLHAVHDAFGAVMSVPRCIASSDPLGLLVLDELPGVPLTRPLVDGGPLPDPVAIAALTERIREVVLPAVEGNRSASAPVAAHASTLSAAVPQEVDRIKRLADLAVDAGAPQEHTVHGDFYEAQILVDSAGTITGLLDIDGAALGSRTDDPATLLGHLLGLAHVHPTAATRINGYRRDVQDRLAAGTDPDRLHAGVTGVLLGLATTPFRRQDPGWQSQTSSWLDVAEAWAGHRT